MEQQNKYYRGLDELNQTPEFVSNANSEFPEFLPTSQKEDGSTSRRDFLKLMGFSVAAVSLASCEAPLKKILPYVNKPEGMEPGNPLYYASTYSNGSEYSSIVVKCRDGRPILIEGNSASSFSKGTTNSKAVASILGLYDSSRAQRFSKGGVELNAADADADITKTLEAVSASGKQIALVSESVASPSYKSVIKDFVAKYPTAKHVIYDASSSSALRKANGGFIPNYDFSEVETVASFNADFLGSYLHSAVYSKDFALTRKVKRGEKAKSKMSKLYQFETIMSLTGSNADVRIPIKPSEEGHYIIALYNKIVGASLATQVKSAAVDKLAVDLLASKGKSIVLSGSNDLAIQSLVSELNVFLGNAGSTIKESKVLTKQGSDESLIKFTEELVSGEVGAVIFLNSNPVYNTPFGKQIADGLKNTKVSVSTADRLDETASLCTYNCPTTHFLESWGDAEPIEGHYSLVQPVTNKIFKQTRSTEESLLTWSGVEQASFYDYVRAYWSSRLYPLSGESNFENFWNKSLELGVFEPKKHYTNTVQENKETAVLTTSITSVVAAASMSAGEAASKINSTYKASAGLELVIYESNHVGTGSLANIPWIYENPDPVSKVCWDNYLAVNPVTAKELGVDQGSLDDGTSSDVVSIVIPKLGKVELPIVVQPGQAQGTIAVAQGFGRTKAGKLIEGASQMYPNPMGERAIGVDVYPFISVLNGNLSYTKPNVVVKKTIKKHRIAQTQTHHTIMGRKIVQESTLDTYKNESKFAQEIDHNYAFYISTSNGKMKPNEVDIWKAPETDENGDVIPGKEIVTHAYPNHHWGLVIDLNSCFGCGACVTSCHAENNVPVVGKDEVLRKRDMHWMRIDRYYKATDEDTLKKDMSFGNLKKLENPDTDNPEVTFQPMMCQHCNHAPCETVCPVVATTHSSEGLNQMTYNRCIGTRYCANNCPYKVRRFNWFNYSDSSAEASGRQFEHVNVTMNDDLGKMVLNPDVTVRARGVMEKCSMCAQRIQAGKLKAKLEKRKLKDGDIVTACASACPTDAIVFGDMNDSQSEISQILEIENADRSFHVLEELNVKPNVSYLTKIRNK